MYAAVTLLYSNGKKSKKLGNFAKWDVDSTIGMQSKTYGYAVCGAYLGSDRGQTAADSIDSIKLKLKFRPEFL